MSMRTVRNYLLTINCDYQQHILWPKNNFKIAMEDNKQYLFDKRQKFLDFVVVVCLFPYCDDDINVLVQTKNAKQKPNYENVSIQFDNRVSTVSVPSLTEQCMRRFYCCHLWFQIVFFRAYFSRHIDTHTHPHICFSQADKWMTRFWAHRSSKLNCHQEKFRIRVIVMIAIMSVIIMLSLHVIICNFKHTET